MNNVIDEMINKKIAEFLGFKTREHSEGYSYEVFDEFLSCWVHGLMYTTSLDALVPVVEKLMKDRIAACGYSKSMDTTRNDLIEYIPFIEWVGKDSEYLVNQRKESPARALALAIYKVLEDM